jgi:hypothetical protein
MMKKLEEYYSRLLSLKFPSSNIEDDQLADFHSELAEIDGYYAGLVERMIKGQLDNPDEIDFRYIKILREKLESINKELLSDNDEIRYYECDSYLVFLENLPTVIQPYKCK